MTLKTKLISCIIAFIMVASLMMVGIFASPTVTLQMGGNVSFSANGVYADITGNIVGTQDHPTGSPLQLSTISIDYTNTETEVDLSGTNSDWTTMPLTFDENGSEITVTMNIQNKASDRAIKVTITDNTNIENVTVERAYNNLTFASNTDTRTINGGGSESYTFKLSVDSQNSPASGSFSLDVKLESTENVATPHNVTITNNYPYIDRPLKVKDDNGKIYTINRGETEVINSSILYLSYRESEISALYYAEIEPYAPTIAGLLYIDGEQAVYFTYGNTYNDMYPGWINVKEQYSEIFEISGEVVIMKVPYDCTISIEP